MMLPSAAKYQGNGGWNSTRPKLNVKKVLKTSKRTSYSSQFITAGLSKPPRECVLQNVSTIGKSNYYKIVLKIVYKIISFNYLIAFNWNTIFNSRIRWVLTSELM